MALSGDLNVQKCSENGVLLTFSLGNVLGATAASACERWCVTKLVSVKDGVCVCDKVVCDKDGGAERSGAGAGYRIKNKNTTQRCGGKCSEPAVFFKFWLPKLLRATTACSF